MCGIAGIVQLDGSEVRADRLGRMILEIAHRGPDAANVFSAGPVGLGHARLAIIDLANGRQPMRSRDGTLALTFNGEIFNYIELRAALRARGHHFATRSDTEVILHAYQEYGDSCVDHFNGQWAFALWDAKLGKLLLSRDRFGIRPLFYTKTGRQLLFASEVKALFVQGEVPRAINPRGLDQLFTFWTTLPPATVFAGIDELPPGCNLTIQAGRTRLQRFWRPEYHPPATAVDETEAADQLAELLADATRLRLRSDVPVGAYLSGGLDSSVLAALVKQRAGQQLRTFSVTFADDEFDESNYQSEVVDFLQTEHQAIRCGPGAIAEVFPDVIRHTEKPVLRTAPAPLYLLARLVHAEGFKVVLTGEGADEMFGGYGLFKEAKVRRFCAAQPDSARRALLLQALYPYLPNIRAQSLAYRKAFFHVRPEDTANPFFSHLPRWQLTSRLKRFFSRDFRARLGDHDVYADARATLPEAFDDWAPFCQAQYLETVMLMPGYILSSQGDRMAMAHSVEGRFPFLDHRVAQFAARLPARLKMKALREKYLLKKAMGHLVPARIVRRSKQPYRAPDANSFFDPEKNVARAPYVEELLSPKQILTAGIFEPAAVARLVEKARQGKVIGMKDNMALVGILSTQLLVDRLLNRPPADSGAVGLAAGGAAAPAPASVAHPSHSTV
ncbi:MAG: asparagine synthase (glutamine-hydrolyzing) [Planctomycetia bacterium]|nr:MAG: asparagine synthase (glutamine-hydrolyzing) [Planctomycetia bacterium]